MVEIIQGNYEKAKQYYEASVRDEYFEFEFPYVPMEYSFKEIDRFLWESRHEKTRFKNYYSGAVLVDISGWNDKDFTQYFDAFMYFLKDNAAYVCTFLVRSEMSKELEQKMREFFEIKAVDLLEERKNKARTIGFADVKQEGANNVRG